MDIVFQDMSVVLMCVPVLNVILSNVARSPSALGTVIHPNTRSQGLNEESDGVFSLFCNNRRVTAL